MRWDIFCKEFSAQLAPIFQGDKSAVFFLDALAEIPDCKFMLDLCLADVLGDLVKHNICANKHLQDWVAKNPNGSLASEIQLLL